LKLKRISRTVSLGLAVLALLALLAAACGDDDDTASKTTSAGGTTASGTVAKGGSTASADGTDAPSTGNGVQDLQNAAKNFKNGDFKITYDVTQTDSSGKATSGTMTMAQKDKKSLFQASNFLDQQGSVAIIDDGSNTYLCTDSPQKTCLKTGTTGGSAGGVADAFRPDVLLGDIDKQGVNIDKAPDQKIAGHDAKCYKVSGNGENGTICIDKKTGFMLLLDGTEDDGTKIKLVAKDVASSASDNDFKPPYTVQSIPGQ
jgi:hypothetical protein